MTKSLKARLMYMEKAREGTFIELKFTYEVQDFEGETYKSDDMKRSCNLNAHRAQTNRSQEATY